MITSALTHLYVSIIWIMDLNMKPKLLEESREENICCLALGQDFLETQKTNKTIDKLYFIKRMLVFVVPCLQNAKISHNWKK